MKTKVTTSKTKYAIIIITLVSLLFLTILFTAIGSVRLSFGDVLGAFISREPSTIRTIIFTMRLPRTVIAVLVGANLAVSGILLQAVMRNPLADPGITGVSSGASVVAVFIILAVPRLMQRYAFFASIGATLMQQLPLFAFAGAAIACMMVFLLAWKNNEVQPLRIVLAGVAVNAILSGFISMMFVLFTDQTHNAIVWLNGNLVASTWADVRTLFLYSIVGLIASLFLIRSANILQLGDEAAKNLGFDVTRTRLVLSAVAVFLAGVTTAVVGIIGFIGLIVPHAARMIMGSDHKYTIPFSIVLGGLVLLVADTLGRAVGGAIEIPVGIVTAIIGGPFFLYLLRKKGA